ncbi:hypothetical protein LTR66_002052 [Elasticomyces elasticus]|nr:hypothetical protein LTR66_002052 [Elasticomyces elasticus]
MAANEKQIETMGMYATDENSEETKGVFGDDKNHEIKYRTLSWPFVAMIMITEIVTGGTLTLPQALAVVGIVPGLILIVFCGVFALFTSLLLIDFKINHPEVHNMGDAGYILFAPFGLGAVGREVLSCGTIIFAITIVGATQLLGQEALATLSGSKVCLMAYTGIFAVPILLCALPRTLNTGLSWFSLAACVSVLIACIVGMAGAGAEPTADRVVSATVPSNFYTAFLSITNPVIAYAGHFMFFPLISEMEKPRDAKKAAWALQIFATTFYAVFAVVTYYYLGNNVQNPSVLSLSLKWAKATWGLLLPNILVGGSLYNHTAAKILFVRIFRNSHHLHSHTVRAWSVWIGLVVLMNALGFVLAVGVPIFAYLCGIAAALFASWYTYGLAGAFWIHDTYHLKGSAALRRHWIMWTICILTILVGTFICVAGMYAIVKSLVIAYATGAVGHPFAC